MKTKAMDSGVMIAIQCFKKLCDQQCYPHLEMLSREDIEGMLAPNLPGLQEMLQQFCNYLVTEESVNTSKNYKLLTAVQYLSGFKTIVTKKHIDLEIFVNHLWYNELFYALKMQLLKAAFSQGKSVTVRTLGIH